MSDPSQISIHSPHARGDQRRSRGHADGAGISIRSPHARGDGRKRCKRCSIQISIHSPHTRGDKQEDGILTWEITFQSTPLTRGETSAGEQIAGSDSISIHSPHARGDYSYLCLYRQYRAFQSTPLMRGETPSLTQKGSASKISIHSPHARGDRCFANRLSALWHFNPLPSCEGRPKSHTRTRSRLKFQSTPLMRGETRVPNRVLPKILISIHSPHARGDFQNQVYPLPDRFQSTPLMRGETFPVSFFFPLTDFNPLPSCEGRQHKPPKIHPDLRQLTQQNHDTPLFGALQAPFCGAEPDIRGAKPTEKP